MIEMSDFERLVLMKVLEGDHPVLNSLRQQLEVCQISMREFTGAGFYTTLVVDKSLVKSIECDLILSDVIAQVGGLQHGAGFVLYVNNGILDVLEGYSYDEPWPEQISSFKLGFMNGEERDWQILGKKLERCRAP
jgi:hypothetical protein